MQAVFRTGFILLILAFGAWIYADNGNVLPIKDLDRILGVTGAILVSLYLVAYLYLKLSGAFWKSSHKSRCARCGKRIRKRELYCDFHKKEVQSEYLSGMSESHDARQFINQEKDE
jgi:hypothetical protein